MPLALSAMAKGMLGALPQGGKCKPQFLWGSEQTLALTPPHHGVEDVQIPFGPASGTPETPLRAEAPVALGAPEAIVATPPSPGLRQDESCPESRSAPHQLSLPPGLSRAVMLCGIKPL